MRKKKYVNRNTQTKAMKTSVTDLQEIVKAALKEAMSEEDCKGCLLYTSPSPRD